ncbi:hypothetical protein ASZ90_009430 [hydrocarbon metagenome]|uniref:Uncharacterized protein n=1 Tax=hydrocarbon metagenome TaxID=938273 RepID=A0A0W8FIS5_9ZZZZ
MRLRDDAESALQLRRYAWNAGLKLSILKNFVDLAVNNYTKPLRKEDATCSAHIGYFN